MRRAVFFAVVVSAFSFSCNAVAQERPAHLAKLPVAEGELSYVVEEGEATVNDDLIRRIAIGREGVTATYGNRTEKRRRAEYTIELYNGYGLLLGEDEAGKAIFGGTGSIEPGDVGTERLNIEWFPLDRLFKKSGVRLPDDWRVVKWVVIKDTNTRSE